MFMILKDPVVRYAQNRRIDGRFVANSNDLNDITDVSSVLTFRGGVD